MALGSWSEALWLWVCTGAAPRGIRVGQGGSRGWLQLGVWDMCEHVRCTLRTLRGMAKG